MTTQTKHRPFGVTLLAIFAYLAGLVAIFHTLQMLHLLPFLKVGEQAFFGFSLFGAIMWIVLALIYFWIGKMLWNLDEQGWLFVVVLATLNLILAFVTVLGHTPFSDMLPAILMNGIVLIYALLPGVKSAFNVTPAPQPQKATARPAPAPAAAQPVEETSSQPAPAQPEDAPAASGENTEA